MNSKELERSQNPTSELSNFKSLNFFVKITNNLLKLYVTFMSIK